MQPDDQKFVRSLYELALSEYRFNVDLTWRRVQIFIWVPALRWALQILSMDLAGPQPTVETVCINSLGNVVGIATTACGIIICLRGTDYYHRARDVVQRLEADLHIERFGLLTAGVDQIVHGLRIRTAILWLLLLYIAADVFVMALWIWSCVHGK